MSINITPPSINPGNFIQTNTLTNPISSGLNSMQSGIMQSLSQVFNMLSQLFASGAQNPMFSGNPLSNNIGNNLGRDSLGQPQVVPSYGNNPLQPVPNFSNNPGQDSLGQPRVIPGNGNQSGPPISVIINNPGREYAGQPIVGPSCGSRSNDLSQQPMNADRAAQVLNKNFDNISGGGGVVTRDDLQRALNDPNSSKEVKDAASYLLNNKDVFRGLDTASGGDRGGPGLGLRAIFGDGKISKADTTAAMVRDGTQLPQEREAINALLAHKDSLMVGDKLISRAELATIAAGGLMPNGQPAPPDLRQAAMFLTQNPEFFSKLEDTNHHLNGGRRSNIPVGDSLIGIDDLLQAQKR